MLSLRSRTKLFFLFIASAKVTASCQVECQLRRKCSSQSHQTPIQLKPTNCHSLVCLTVKEPAMDLAIGCIQRPVLHQQVNLKRVKVRLILSQRV